MTYSRIIWIPNQSEESQILYVEEFLGESSS